MRKRRQYRRLQEHDYMVYGSEWMGSEELWQKQQYHYRYADRLRKLLNKHR